jgi:DnaK suppressor protein
MTGPLSQTPNRDQFCHDMANALLQKRLEISQLAEYMKGSGAPVELDQTRLGRLSRMDAMAQQQMAKAGHSRLMIELQCIEAALTRFEQGRYGMCCRCKVVISADRLTIDPATPFCRECQQEVADQNAAGRP